jgi:hypothetical protein
VAAAAEFAMATVVGTAAVPEVVEGTVAVLVVEAVAVGDVEGDSLVSVFWAIQLRA